MRDVLDTNVTGVFNVTRAVVPHMISQRAGRIVNLSSVSGDKGGRGQTNYAASKGAINAFTRALAVELAPRKIRVNGVAPGVIETEMSQDVREQSGDEVKSRILLRRYGKPEEVAYAVWFLASAYASYVTGQVLQRRRRLQNGVSEMAQTEITQQRNRRGLSRRWRRRWPTRSAATSRTSSPTASLIEDLDAESIDFLDMVFRLERAFKIKIPRGKIVENARGALSEAEFEQKGVVTDAGLAQLKSVPLRSAGRALQDAAEGDGHPAAVHAGDVLQARDRRAARSAGERLKRLSRKPRSG